MKAAFLPLRYTPSPGLHLHMSLTKISHSNYRLSHTLKEPAKRFVMQAKSQKGFDM